MIIIAQPRATGKTTALIRLSAEKGYYIVTANLLRANDIREKAFILGLKIPLPITWQEFLDGRFYARGVNGFLVDDAEQLIQYIARGVPVEAITITHDDISQVIEDEKNIPPEIRFKINHLNEWKK